LENKAPLYIYAGPILVPKRRGTQDRVGWGRNTYTLCKDSLFLRALEEGDVSVCKKKKKKKKKKK